MSGLKRFSKVVTYKGDKYLVINDIDFYLYYILKIYKKLDSLDSSGEEICKEVYTETEIEKIFKYIKYGKGYENIYINLIKCVFKDYENKEKNIEKEQLKILKEWDGIIE